MTFDDRVSHAKRLKSRGIADDEIRQLHGSVVLGEALRQATPKPPRREQFDTPIRTEWPGDKQRGRAAHGVPYSKREVKR